MHLSVEPPDFSPGDRRYDNEFEAWNVCEILMRIRAEVDHRNETKKRVLVITPYKDQVRLLNKLIGRVKHWFDDVLDVRVCTVDSCQGAEVEIAIMSFVWRDGNIGYLAEWLSRWLVPLTRGRDYSIWLLHAETFERPNPRSPEEAQIDRFLEFLRTRTDQVHRHIDRRSKREIGNLMFNRHYHERTVQT